MRSPSGRDRKSTRLNSSHTVIYTLSLHDALPISHYTASAQPIKSLLCVPVFTVDRKPLGVINAVTVGERSEEHTSELQSHRDLHSFPTRRSSDLALHGERPADQIAPLRPGVYGGPQAPGRDQCGHRRG